MMLAIASEKAPLSRQRYPVNTSRPLSFMTNKDAYPSVSHSAPSKSEQNMSSKSVGHNTKVNRGI